MTKNEIMSLILKFTSEIADYLLTIPTFKDDIKISINSKLDELASEFEAQKQEILSKKIS